MLSEDELLAPLEGKCFVMETGWWTYRLCHKRHLEQSHHSTKHTMGRYSERDTENCALLRCLFLPINVVVVSRRGGPLAVGLHSATRLVACYRPISPRADRAARDRAAASAEEEEPPADNGGDGHVTILGFSTETMRRLPDTYVSHLYTNGRVCDENGQPRRAEVRLSCNPHIKTARIAAIQEPSICEYIVSVETSLLCPHPRHGAAIPRPVTCYAAGD